MILRTLLLALLLPASASAATLGEVAPLEIRGDACVGATGVPGEIAYGTNAGVRFLRASRGGLTRGPEVRLATRPQTGYFNCYQVSVRASGAGVIVGSADGDLVAVVRDPGGTWSAPRRLVRRNDDFSVGNVSAAVSDRGDVLVAWTSSGGESRRYQFVRRAPGGAFGSVGALPVEPDGSGSIKAAVAADGEAFLAWTGLEGTKPPFVIPVWVSSAPSGGAFGAPVRVLGTRLHGTPALAVAPDGRALVAGWDGSSVLVAERAPGAAFGPAVAVAAAGGRYAGVSAVMAAGGGAAILVDRPVEGDTLLVSRASAGAFSAPVTVASGDSLVPPGVDPFFLSESYDVFSGLASPTFDDGPPAPRLTDDGRAVVAAQTRSRRSRMLGVAQTLATVPLGTGAFTAASVPPQIFDESEPEPLVLDDGTPALLWTESDDPTTFYDDKPYRLHVAAEGIAEPVDPPAPRVTLGAPPDRSLDADDELRLPVRCSAACVVRARLEYEIDPLQAVVRLSRAGRGTLTLSNASIVAPVRPGPVRVHLSYGAPGALHPRERTETIRISRSVLLPRTTAVRARRSGDTIRVSWRVRHPADGLDYFVSGAATRTADGDPLVTRAAETLPNRSRFSVTLRGARDVRYVTVRPEIPYGPGARSVVVRVSG